jgi:hypothetical protein
MKKSVTTVATTPHAYITKQKQRVKQFNQTVYLQNGDEFEIELFNPTTNKVLAKIEINGNSIGGLGIVLRPGERVFLERYLNDSKKFLFETYKVSGKSYKVEQAIKNNGDIVVKFYNEYFDTRQHLLINNRYGWENPTIFYNTPRYDIGTTITTNTLVGQGCTYTTSPNDSLSFTSSTRGLSEDKPKEIETGRVEKGSNSDQSFTDDDATFKDPLLLAIEADVASRRVQYAAWEDATEVSLFEIFLLY